MVNRSKWLFLVFILHLLWIPSKGQVFDDDSVMVYISGRYDTLYCKEKTTNENVEFLKKNGLYRKFLKLEKRTKSKPINEIQEKYCKILGAYLNFKEDLMFDTIILNKLSREEKQQFYIIDESKNLYRQVVWMQTLISTNELLVTLNDSSFESGSRLMFYKGGLVYPSSTVHHSYEDNVRYILKTKKHRRLALWACLLHKRTIEMLS